MLKYFGTAIILHLLLAIGLLYTFSKMLLPAPNNEKLLIPIQLIHSSPASSTEVHKNPSIAEKTIKKIIPHPPEKTILKILHAAIANNQTYPEAAIALEQKGKVEIGFYLAPNGKLTDIHLLKSSGFPLLDQAALAAASAVSPIQAAGRLLTKTTFFSVAVIFS